MERPPLFYAIVSRDLLPVEWIAINRIMDTDARDQRSMMRVVSGSRCRPSSARLRLIHARMIAIVSGCRAAYVRDKQLAAPEINEQQFFGGGKPVLNIRLW